MRAREQEIEEVGAAELLRCKAPSIVVKRGDRVDLSPDSHPEHYRRVRLAAFEDLQQLRLVAPRLTEARAREALAADDEAAHVLAERQAGGGKADDCGCTSGAKATYATAYRQTYDRVRAFHNRTLARVLTEAQGVSLAWDDLEVSLTRRILDAWAKRRLGALLAALADDVTVGHGATVTLAASTQLFQAGEVRVHLGGRIECRSSSLHFNCRTFAGQLA